ncbi:hypothetical protein O6H91_04G060300 [Diphasiastrum complanatum]|uniref:Uncharacterized protein n=1 Tax=Diphasiastrum complanatum TaxID=34168 RepID=A0ACC2DX59_DIPCM|nr:hypothetical protein O6H91_04G060300 [Diphasiastrum complanatum]
MFLLLFLSHSECIRARVLISGGAIDAVSGVAGKRTLIVAFLISWFFFQKTSLSLIGSPKAIHEDLDPIHAITSPAPSFCEGS